MAVISALVGGATLAGEVLGARLLRPMVGSTAMAQSGAVAGVLGGMGLGAWWVGQRLARGSFAPRRILHWTLIACMALTALAPWVAKGLTKPSARWLATTALRTSWVADGWAMLLTVLATVPFGLLAGGVYPALVALYGRGSGRGTAVSGAASSLGASMAVLLIAFVLAPAFGVRKTLFATIALYGAALAFVRTFAQDDFGDDKFISVLSVSRGERAKTEYRSGCLRTPVVALFLVGFASMVWQFAMTRLGVLAFGPSALALAAALAAHTSALGLGEAAITPHVDGVRDPSRTVAKVLLAAAVFAVAIIALGCRLPVWNGMQLRAGTFTLPSLWARAFVMLVAVTLPVIGLVGVCGPLGARWLGDGGLARWEANGRALLFVAAGNVAGALLTPMVLIPWLSLPGTLLTAAMALAIAASVAMETNVWRSWKSVLFIAMATVMLLLGSWAAVRRWDVTSLLSGPFLYARDDDIDLGTVLHVDDGREATVAVRRDDSGAVLLQINGKIDATSAGDAATQILLGVVPTVLSSHPRNVLVIGLGSGMTVDAVRDVPGVAHVDVVEVIPEVIRAARGPFRQVNHNVLDSPKVRTILQDAALYLRGTTNRYDVIVSEPSNPWVATMADFFTVEVFTAARERLQPGGVMAVWFHGYSTDADMFTNILGTFREVFPRAVLFEIVPGQDYVMVGMTEPVGVDVDRVVEKLSHPSLRPHLERAGVTERGAFFGRFVAGMDGIRAMTTDYETLYAQDLRLEFRAPRLLYHDASESIFVLLARAQDLPLAGLRPHGKLYDTVMEESEPVREAALHARQMVLARAARDLSGAIAEGEQAVAANPRDPSLRTALARLYIQRAGRRFRRRDPAGAEEDLRTALELRPAPAESFRAHVTLGDLALMRNALDVSAREYGAALEIARTVGAPAPELHVRMAQVLIALGDSVHARAELDRAVRECSNPRRQEEIMALRRALDDARPVPLPRNEPSDPTVKGYSEP